MEIEIGREEGRTEREAVVIITAIAKGIENENEVVTGTEIGMVVVVATTRVQVKSRKKQVGQREIEKAMTI